MLTGRPGDEAPALDAFAAGHYHANLGTNGMEDSASRELLLAGPWPEWTPMADRYLERLRRRSSAVALVSATVSASSTPPSTGSGAPASAGQRTSAASSTRRAKNKVAVDGAQSGHGVRASGGRGGGLGVASRACAAEELRYMSKACGDAMRRIDELEAATQQLLFGDAPSGTSRSGNAAASPSHHAAAAATIPPPEAHRNDVNDGGHLVIAPVVPLNLWPAEPGSPLSSASQLLFTELSRTRSYASSAVLSRNGSSNLSRSASVGGRDVDDKRWWPEFADKDHATISGEVLRSLAVRTFQAFDPDGKGFLPWGGGTICDYVSTVFQQGGLRAPDESETYSAYTHFDKERNMVLHMDACVGLVFSLFQAREGPASSSTAEAFATAERVEDRADLNLSSMKAVAAEDLSFGDQRNNEHMPSSQKYPRSMRGNVYSEPAAPSAYPAEQHPTIVAESWVSSYVALPTAGTVSITYSSGVVVDFAAFEECLRPLARKNADCRTRMVESIENGDLMRSSLEQYKHLDHGGYLLWAGGEVFHFVAEVVKAFGLEGFADKHVFPMYCLFDSDGSGHLNASECLCLVDALFRSLAHVSITDAPTDDAESHVAAGMLTEASRSDDRKQIPSDEPVDNVLKAIRENAPVASDETAAVVPLARHEAGDSQKETEEEAEQGAASPLARFESTHAHEDAKGEAKQAREDAVLREQLAELRAAAGDLKAREEEQTQMARRHLQEREALQAQLFDLREAAQRSRCAHEEAEAEGAREREGLRARIAELSSSRLMVKQTARAESEEVLGALGVEKDLLEARMFNVRTAEDAARQAHREEREALEQEVMALRTASDEVAVAIEEDRATFSNAVSELRAACQKAEFDHQRDRLVLKSEAESAWKAAAENKAMAAAPSRDGWVQCELASVGAFSDRQGNARATIEPEHGEREATASWRDSLVVSASDDRANGGCQSGSFASFIVSSSPRSSSEDDERSASQHKEDEDDVGPLPLLSSRCNFADNLEPGNPCALAEQWLAHYVHPPVATTPAIAYSPSLTIVFAELAEAFAPTAAANAPRRSELVKALENGDLIRRALDTFNAVDKNCEGYLHWGAGCIQRLVTAIFHQRDMIAPTENQVRFVFERFDHQHNGSLSALECLHMVDAILRCIISCDGMCSPCRSSGPDDDRSPPTSEPMQGTVEFRCLGQELSRATYLGHHALDFSSHAAALTPLAAANAAHRAAMLRSLESGALLQAAIGAFQSHRGERSALEWADGSIYSFVKCVFEDLGLHPPAEDQTYALFAAFDSPGTVGFKLRECLALVDALVRGACLWEETGHAHGSASPSAGLPPRGEHASSSIDAKTVASATNATIETASPPPNLSAGVSGDLDGWVRSYSPPPVETTSIMYLSKAHVSFRPIPAAARPAPPSAAVAARLAEAIASGEAMRDALLQYKECEMLQCGFLTAGEVSAFVRAVFQKYDLEPPNKELSDWIYKHFDPDSNLYLDARECLCLAEAHLRVICLSVVDPPEDREQLPQRATYSAESWAMDYTAPPMDGTHRISYLGNVTVTFADFAAALQPVAAMNDAHYKKTAEDLETGALVRRALQVYKDCDREQRGFLSWENDGIWTFVASVFEGGDLSPPTKAQIYPIFSAFDVGGRNCLDSSECLCLVDSIVRAMFASRNRESKHSTKVASTSPEKPPRSREARSEAKANSKAPPPVTTASIVYLDGLVEVSFPRLSAVLSPLARGSAVDSARARAHLIRDLEDGSATNASWQLYQTCDRHKKGYLEWKSNEVQDFVTTLFRHSGFKQPSEEQIYHLYMIFDVDRSLRLGAQACICLADAALRAVLYVKEAGLDKTAKHANGRDNEPHAPPSACEAPQFVEGSLSPQVKNSPRQVSFASRHESVLLELSEATGASDQSTISHATPAESLSPDTSQDRSASRHRPCAKATLAENVGREVEPPMQERSRTASAISITSSTPTELVLGPADQEVLLGSFRGASISSEPHLQATSQDG